MNRKIPSLIILLLIFFPVFLIIPQLQNNLVSADIDEVIDDNNFSDIDTLTLEDDFEEKYYNNIYSQYENATVTIPPSSYTLRPNAVGTHSQLQTAGDDPAWKCIDDVSPDGDDTWVGATSLIVEQTATVNIEDLGSVSGTIQNVTIYFHAKKTINDGYYYLTIRTTDGSLYNTSIPITFGWITYEVTYLLNPSTSVNWTWSDIDSLELGGSTMKLDTYSARLSQVYCIVYNEPEVELGSTTTYKKQDRSYYRAYGGLYSYFHNVSRNYTDYDIVIKHNSSIIINFVSLNIFPQALTFFLYFNCYYNISLFIGTEEYVLKTHDYSTDDWKWVSIRLNRREYLITDLDVDFYLKIYPIENNNTYDIFHMDNLKVKYTDPEQVINYFSECYGGEGYDDWVLINDTSSSFYASGTGENPAGWLEDGTSDGWDYRTYSNKIMSRGMKIHTSWTLRDWTDDNYLYIFTDMVFTIDKEYHLYERIIFSSKHPSFPPEESLVTRLVRLYTDDVLTYEMSNHTVFIDDIFDEYYDLTHTIELSQLNEHTMQYASSFANLYTNQTDWRPLIFNINEEIQSGLNIMDYGQRVRYTADGSASTNPIIQQKTIVDIHNTPISDFTIPDIEGGFFRNIWDRLMYYMGEATGLEGLMWQYLNMQRAYEDLAIDMMNDMVEGIDNPDWIEEYQDDIQDIQDDWADGIVTSWRKLFADNDYEGLGNKFQGRWGNFFLGGLRGERASIFSVLFGGLVGEDVQFIPKFFFMLWENARAFFMIGIVIGIIIFMRALLRGEMGKVKGYISAFISFVIFAFRIAQWFINLIIRVITMIAGFIPFT